MFDIDDTVPPEARSAIIMSILIQMGKQLDDIGERGAALHLAEASLILAEHQEPRNLAEEKSLIDIRTGLREVVGLLKQPKKTHTLQ